MMTQEDNARLDHALMLRRFLINLTAGPRDVLEQRWGQVWNTEELGRDFEVNGFRAPLVVVRRKADGKVGSLLFQHAPRYYWGWEEYDPN